jgi:hypothetical protein
MRVEIEIHPDGLFVNDTQVNIPSLYEIPGLIDVSIWGRIVDRSKVLDNGVGYETYIERDISLEDYAEIPDKLREKITQELRDEILPLYPL